MSGSDVIKSRKAIIGAGLLATLALFMAMMFAVATQAQATGTAITGDMIKMDVSNKTYTGSEIKPDVTVIDGSKTLTEDVDYTLTYTNNTNVGQATVTVEGKSSYTSSASKNFSIVAKGIGSVSVDAIADQEYTGSAIEPTVTVKDGTTELVEGTDYTLSYTDNTKVGSALVTISGKGNYTSVKGVNFIIKPAKMTSTKIVAKDQVYTGSPVTTTVTVTFGGEELTKNTDFTITKYYNNTEIGMATVVVEGMGSNFEGEAAAYFNITDGSSVTMYRVYNPNSGEHFYTASVGERDHLVEVGWKDEGTGWYAPATSATPVYRLYNPNAGDHHYTTSSAERDNLVSVGWSDEGTGWYSDDAETVPVLRQYNPNAKAGAHNFTTSQAENDHLVSVGWSAEGTGWYAVKAA